METRAHYVVIGSIVLVSMAMFLSVILWLSQTQQDYDEYDVVFRDRVSGLSVGAHVSFNGIQKGLVKELIIDPDDPSVVRARVHVDRDTPIKTDTVAELELVGFTGVAIIQFLGGSPEKPLLKDTMRGVPSINASAGGIAQIFEGGNDIISAANKLLSDDNIEAFRSILGSVDIFLGAFAEQEENVGVTIENLAKITTDVAKATDEIDRLVTDLQRVMGKDAPQTLKEADKAIGEARALLGELRAIAEENREPLAIFSNEALAQTGPAIAEARRVMRSLDRVLREIDRNPRGYLLGESTPEYEGTN